ncbi:MAG: hypothetical protein MJZ15_01260 [Bacteroidales bacterium]|nr:hypothetical protein [Bacteroidales bacterium]
MNNKREYTRPLLIEVTAVDADVILMSGSVFEPDEDELLNPNSRSFNKSSIFQTPEPSLKSSDHIAPDNISGNTIF